MAEDQEYEKDDSRSTASWYTRAWKAEDLDALADMIHLCALASDPEAPWLGHAFMLGRLQSLFEDSERNYFHVACDSEESVAGCASVGDYPYDGKTAVVNSVYVYPEWRRIGVARQVVQAVIDKAAAKGYERVILGVDNPHARKLYESLGFEQIEIPAEISAPGEHSCDRHVP